ncbi:hypothetical protein Tco_0165106 [Tanacetum coccineum]
MCLRSLDIIPRLLRKADFEEDKANHVEDRANHEEHKANIEQERANGEQALGTVTSWGPALTPWPALRYRGCEIDDGIGGQVDTPTPR